MIAPHVMTAKRIEELQEEFRKATEKWNGECFQHFVTELERQRHLDEVKALQDSGKVPF